MVGRKERSFGVGRIRGFWMVLKKSFCLLGGLFLPSEVELEARQAVVRALDGSGCCQTTVYLRGM